MNSFLESSQIAVSEPTQTNYNPHKREPAKLPEAIGEKRVYITTLKAKCPTISITLLGLNFDAYTLSPEASEPKNEMKVYQTKYLARKLAQNQVEALEKRAREVFIKAGNQEICAADWINLVPVEQFNPLGAYKPSDVVSSAMPVQQNTQEEQVQPDLRQAIYDAQGKGRKK